MCSFFYVRVEAEITLVNGTRDFLRRPVNYYASVYDPRGPL